MNLPGAVIVQSSLSGFVEPAIFGIGLKLPVPDFPIELGEPLAEGLQFPRIELLNLVFDCFESAHRRNIRIAQRRSKLGDTANMKFRVVIERDPETGDYSAVCPELPGCASAGETEEEAEANIREAIDLYTSAGGSSPPH